MGISRITAFEIQTNGDDIKCSAGGPSKVNGKYAGWIELWRDGELHKPILKTEPIFETAKEAESHMIGIVDEIRQMEPLLWFVTMIITEILKHLGRSVIALGAGREGHMGVRVAKNVTGR